MHIGYVTIKKIHDYENIHNPFYLIIYKADGNTDAENGKKYLIFASKQKEVLTKYTESWDKIKYLIRTINGGKVDEYEKWWKK